MSSGTKIGTRCPPTTKQVGGNDHYRTIIIPDCWADPSAAFGYTVSGITSFLTLPELAKEAVRGSKPGLMKKDMASESHIFP
jgi:hypothetical protein